MPTYKSEPPEQRTPQFSERSADHTSFQNSERHRLIGCEEGLKWRVQTKMEVGGH